MALWRPWKEAWASAWLPVNAVGEQNTGDRQVSKNSHCGLSNTLRPVWILAGQDDSRVCAQLPYRARCLCSTNRGQRQRRATGWKTDQASSQTWRTINHVKEHQKKCSNKKRHLRTEKHQKGMNRETSTLAVVKSLLLIRGRIVVQAHSVWVQHVFRFNSKRLNAQSLIYTGLLGGKFSTVLVVSRCYTSWGEVGLNRQHGLYRAQCRGEMQNWQNWTLSNH